MIGESLKGKKVAVLGLGVEGISSAKFLTRHGADVTILDQKVDEELDQSIRSAVRSLRVKLILGSSYLDHIEGFDIIVRSPGVKRSLPQIQDAEKKGVLVTSQTQLFFDMCPAPIIGVTGTKGKGTTATLIYEMLKEQDLDVYLGGNIGVSPFEFLEKLQPHSWVVLELSSFQLQDLTKSPHISVMLMTTSEHLDYHKDVYEYVSAKRNIFRFQKATDFAVINKDYPASRESDLDTEGRVYWISREDLVRRGCYVKQGYIYFKFGENDEEELISTKDIKLPGEHNFENVCAAVMAARLAGAGKKSIVKVLKEFQGLEHRLEFVTEVGGVRYYDDSFSTTPETTIAAIRAFQEPEILILGGSSKNSDFTELGKVISERGNIKAIIGIGTEWTRIKEAIGSHSGKSDVHRTHPESDRSWTSPSTSSGHSQDDMLLIEGAKDMHKIVQAASKIAQPGDVVILSPACASFDMFKNYKDRGEQFKEEVLKLG